MEVFALIVILVLLGAGIGLVVFFGNLPGRMARDAGHPQADAIALLGWLGLLFGVAGWFVALVWARVRPGPDPALAERLAELEARMDAIAPAAEGGNA